MGSLQAGPVLQRVQVTWKKAGSAGTENTPHAENFIKDYSRLLEKMGRLVDWGLKKFGKKV